MNYIRALLTHDDCKFKSSPIVRNFSILNGIFKLNFVILFS